MGSARPPPAGALDSSSVYSSGSIFSMANRRDRLAERKHITRCLAS